MCQRDRDRDLQVLSPGSEMLVDLTFFALFHPKWLDICKNSPSTMLALFAPPSFPLWTCPIKLTCFSSHHPLKVTPITPHPAGSLSQDQHLPSPHQVITTTVHSVATQPRPALLQSNFWCGHLGACPTPYHACHSCSQISKPATAEACPTYQYLTADAA